VDITYSYEYHTRKVYTRTYIYLQNSTRPSAHDNSVTEKCSLHASHSLAPHTRCKSLAQPHPTPHHFSHPPPSARRAVSSSEWLQLPPSMQMKAPVGSFSRLTRISIAVVTASSVLRLYVPCLQKYPGWYLRQKPVGGK